MQPRPRSSLNSGPANSAKMAIEALLGSCVTFGRLRTSLLAKLSGTSSDK